MKRLGALALALAAGCGGASNPNAPALHDVEAAVRAFDRALGISTAFVVSGNVDVTATPEIIANSLYGRVQAEAAGCVSATHSGPTVHADLGGGCTLATASMRAGGTIDLTVGPDPNGGILVALTLAATVDGQALGGSFDVATPNGSAFTYAGALTLDGTMASLPLVRAGIASGGATLDAANGKANAAPLGLAAVHERFAGCYPDDGVATVGTLAVTFASDTPQSGSATSAGGATLLPRRAGCPPR